jgi:hypothetical protein
VLSGHPGEVVVEEQVDLSLAGGQLADLGSLMIRAAGSGFRPDNTGTKMFQLTSSKHRRLVKARLRTTTPEGTRGDDHVRRDA